MTAASPSPYVPPFRPAANTPRNAVRSSASSGRRNARLPKLSTNCCEHTVSPRVAVSHGAILARFVAFVTARLAALWATDWYASTRRRGVVIAAASLLRPFPLVSGGNRSPGLVASLSKSRSVLLYSKRVSLRTGEAPGLGAVQFGPVGPVVPPPVAAPVPVDPAPAPGPVVDPPGSPESFTRSPILPWQPPVPTANTI